MSNHLQRGIAVAIGIGIAALGLAVAKQSRAEPEKASLKPMRIGVIGAGALGGTVGRVLVEAGHEVKFSSRHPEELAAMVRALGPRASVGMPREAAEFGTVLLFAVPYEALPELGRDLKDEIGGKVVLDACNASSRTDSALAREVQGDGTGLTSAKLLPNTRLVRAFSAVDATQVEASFKHEREKLGVPLARDDAEAMQIAAQLVRDAGCEPVIVGNLAACKSFDRRSRLAREHDCAKSASSARTVSINPNRRSFWF
jgi:predicted dinucleotide-binding enzyme